MAAVEYVQGCVGKTEARKDRLGILQLKPAWPLAILDDGPRLGTATFLRRFHCIFTLAEAHWVGPGGEHLIAKGVKAVALHMARPLSSRGWSSF